MPEEGGRDRGAGIAAFIFKVAVRWNNAFELPYESCRCSSDRVVSKNLCPCVKEFTDFPSTSTVNCVLDIPEQCFTDLKH